MSQRIIQEVRRAQPSRDGDGVAIQRIAGMQHAAMDPILMLDELRAERREDLGGGFPPHPHRGMQTLTYMKHGGIIHEDSRGNRGEIRGGGVQWMSAGRGIIHSEMPTQDTEGLHGFQLWINLPATDGNYAWEWWYKFQVTDNISITPALYYLSRPYGAISGRGSANINSTFNDFAGLLKTTFRF